MRLQRKYLAGIAIVFFSLLASACYVNQPFLDPVDRLSPDAPTSATPNASGIAYGPQPIQLLDYYLPTAPLQGTIIWLHSGGWCCGDRSNVDPFILSLRSKGYGIVSVEYPLSPNATIDQMLASIDRSIRYVKVNASLWGLGGKILVAGGSAGGHLALMMGAASGLVTEVGLPPALASTSPKVDGVIAFAAPSDLRQYIHGEIYVPGIDGQGLVEDLIDCSLRVGSTFPPCTEERMLYYSPYFWAMLNFYYNRDLPPVYFALGTEDSLVPLSTQGEPIALAWQGNRGFFRTWLDRPPTGHNVAFHLNKTAFEMWISTHV